MTFPHHHSPLLSLSPLLHRKHIIIAHTPDSLPRITTSSGQPMRNLARRPVVGFGEVSLKMRIMHGFMPRRSYEVYGGHEGSLVLRVDAHEITSFQFIHHLRDVRSIHTRTLTHGPHPRRNSIPIELRSQVRKATNTTNSPPPPR